MRLKRKCSPLVVEDINSTTHGVDIAHHSILMSMANECIFPARMERERLVQVFRNIDRWRQRLVANFFPGLT